jgi:hypothetical protein
MTLPGLPPYLSHRISAELAGEISKLVLRLRANRAAALPAEVALLKTISDAAISLALLHRQLANRAGQP